MLEVGKHYKIAMVAPTPFYYQVPLFRRLADSTEIDLDVFYCSDETVRGVDVEKKYSSKNYLIKKDMMAGYNYKFLKNYSPCPSFMTRLIGLINFGIWGEIKKGKYDLVILQSWANMTWWLAFLACLRFNVPIAFTTDTNIFDEKLISRFRVILKKIVLAKFFFKKASVFLFSGAANKAFYEYYGVPEKKMVKFPYWWGFEELPERALQMRLQREKMRESFGVNKNDFVLLFVGRFAKEKDIFTLLEAYSRVPHQNKKLFMVGGGPLKKDIEKYIRDLKIKGVYFPGFASRDKVADFYNISDALVLPSTHEPWGMVVAEAMCFGLPVIVSDRVGAGLDLAKDGYNGFIFPAKDSEKLALCIERLINLSLSGRKVFSAKSIEIINRWIKNSDVSEQIPKIFKLLNKNK